MFSTFLAVGDICSIEPPPPLLRSSNFDIVSDENLLSDDLWLPPPMVNCSGLCCCSVISIEGDPGSEFGDIEGGRSDRASDRSGLGLFLFGNVWSREPPLARSSRSLELRHFIRRFWNQILTCKRWREMIEFWWSWCWRGISGRYLTKVALNYHDSFHPHSQFCGVGEFVLLNAKKHIILLTLRNVFEFPFVSSFMLFTLTTHFRKSIPKLNIVYQIYS